ncbi:MarR family protein [Leptospira fainei serovar Hurstbridge str. BUT 6]|uniref:MarR family protein n=1 Tax=Leptospira fainei serovar Hurstbridge str. BUT 6 TaxID=1193011 RepID=S3W5H7_9LEPT|nr:bifunctional helix-turn-helix transcriptional regulator/GNAT family N-acetyltransferase [Leptospira fainei]EPG75472.1 MarR family protein [Leptospira fainei serovar Hurstbridge str. BUT 6]
MEQYIDIIRDFNRYYTNALGLLNTRFLDSKYSLTEARLIFEIGQESQCTASQLANLLDIDKGYLSRTLKKFEQNGLITRTKNKLDSRILNLHLTKRGKQALSQLNKASRREISDMIAYCSDTDRSNLVSSMDTIRKILSQTEMAVSIREKNIGDLGYIIYRHAILYANEFDFNESFEEYVIQGISDYLKNRSSLDKIWIAECNHQLVGAVALLQVGREKGQIRWLYTEPKYRNLGIGKNLLSKAIEYGQNHYSQISLWTLNHLHAARNLYKRFHFVCTESKRNDNWNTGLIEEKWELYL